jgi:tripeptide aminopeptidase
MDLNRLIDRTMAIQAIPAPTFFEAARVSFLRDEFERAGLQDVACDEVGNLYGRVPGGANLPVIVTAHLDSVFTADASLEAKREGNRLYGTGIGDNAVGLAALVELGTDLHSIPLTGDVWLVANVCEEGLGNLRGMQKVVDRFGDQVKAYLALEGMALGFIFHRGLPVRRYRLSAHTQGGHAWIHADKPSAIHSLISLGSDLFRLSLPKEPRTTLNIGRMEGGTSINTIAGHASMEIDLRSEEASTLASLEKQVISLAKIYNRSNVEVAITLIGERPGGGLPENHPLVLAAIRAMEESGISRIFLKTGSTDASIPLSLGLPAICVGITHGGNAHCQDEYIELQPIQQGYNAFFELIRAALMLNDATR